MEDHRSDIRFPTRTLWVSDIACARWKPHFEHFTECWRHLEWLTVVDHVRPCGMLSLSTKEVAKLANNLDDFGIRVMPIDGNIVSDGITTGLMHQVVVGRPSDLKVFRQAWKHKSHDTIGELLGYPRCCRSLFVNSSGKHNIRDLFYEAALNSSNQKSEQILEVIVAPELNSFWVHAGIKLVPHSPCRFNCPDAIALSAKFVACGVKAGYQKILETTSEMLRWPAVWSALHGIAEIKTPILKICYPSVSTNHKHVVRYKSTHYPLEGAKSPNFPYNLGSRT